MIGNLSKEETLVIHEQKIFKKMVKNQVWNKQDEKNFDLILENYPSFDQIYYKKNKKLEIF